MPDYHDLPAKTYRPEPDEHDPVKAALPPGHTMDGFIRATLRWARANPAAAFEILAPHWPPARRIGRRPKAPGAQPPT